MIGTFFALLVLTLGIVGSQPVIGSLPAILQPDLHDGQQFRYVQTYNVDGPMHDRMVWPLTDTVTLQPGQPLQWKQHYTAGDREGLIWSFQVDAKGSLINLTKNQTSSDASFLYNRGLFGDPPATLITGVKWQTRITGANPLGPPFGTMTVEATTVDPSQRLVVLRFTYELNARIGYPAENGDPAFLSRDVARITGTAAFKNGIMTSLISSGSNGHDMPNGRRLVYSSKQTTTLLQ